MSKTLLQSVALASVLVGWGCSSGGGGGPGGSTQSPGGSTTSAGQTASGGGSTSAGGTTSAGGGSTTAPNGGTTTAGGTTSSGGETSPGGSTARGGTTSSGGATSSAGATGTTGGATGTGSGGRSGGSTATSGGTAVGGTTGSGGVTGSGGSGRGGTGGATGTGGANTGGAAGGTTGSGGTTGTSSGVTVQTDDKHQTIEGFGLNTALGGGSVPSSFYSTSGADGLGFSIVRVGMTSSGGLSGSKVSGASKVIGSVWTAGASCKDNNNTQKGGHLLTSCYDSFSTTIANFAKNQGLYAMSAANEPDFGSCGSSIGPPCNGDYDSMVYTANEMVAFVKALGPKMKTAGVKLMAPEPSEWIHLWSNTSATGSTVSGHPNSSDPLKCGCFGNDPVTTGCASTCTSGGGYDYGHWLFKDSTAWDAVDIIGTHEYDTQKAMAWPSDVDGGKRTKEVWETEVSGVMYWPEQGPSSDINNGIAVAGWVHSALVVGEASAWLYWWYQTSGSDDNEGLVLKSSTALTKRCYTIANYSRFVRPGYVMVGVTGNANANLLLSAFTGTDGTVAVVAINKSTSTLTVPITIAGGTAPASCTPNVTSSSANLTAGTAVTVTGGTFSAALAGSSVTTFVCK